jgi:hypothetical protein
MHVSTDSRSEPKKRLELAGFKRGHPVPNGFTDCIGGTTDGSAVEEETVGASGERGTAAGALKSNKPRLLPFGSSHFNFSEATPRGCTVLPVFRPEMVSFAIKHGHLTE